MWYALFRILHWLALLVFAGIQLVQAMAMPDPVSKKELESLWRLNRIGLSALILAAAAGLLLWLVVGRPAGFYSLNPVFHAKLVLFGLLLLLAVYQTLLVRKLRFNDQETAAVPRLLRHLPAGSLLLLALTLVPAWLIARGMGLS